MKKILGIILAVILTLTGVAVSAEVRIKVIIDDKIVEADAIVENDRTLVPLRTIMENAGCEVVWFEDEKKIDVMKGDTYLTLWIGNNVMNTITGDIILDVSPAIYGEGTTYLPIRSVCEEFGMTVDWDGGTRTVLVLTNDASPYFDIYNGMTVEEYAQNNNLTNEEVAKKLLTDYEEIKDKTLIEAENMIKVSSIAQNIGITLREISESYDVELSGDTTLGEFLGELTLNNYFKYIGALNNFPSAESALTEFKNYYSLGEEYTLDTKYKFVRTIVDTFDNQNTSEDEASEKLAELTENKLKFTITLNDGSLIKGELYPDIAPITVANFKKLADEGFYNGLIFHRVIDGFMIQGGGYDARMNAKETASIKGEFSANGVDNILSHKKGVISMARTNEPDSASSQFFIMDEDNNQLDGLYAAFGIVTEGLDIVNKISEVETKALNNGMYDVPVTPVVIKSIVVE